MYEELVKRPREAPSVPEVFADPGAETALEGTK